jgi:contractile injection system tube protein/LysM domain-containing protein
MDVPGRIVNATLTNISQVPTTTVEVQFNPTEYGIDRGASYAELQVPGLQKPLLQFVRGEAEALTLDLFLDATVRPSVNPQSVEDRLTKIREFVTIVPALHAPPVCRFQWLYIVFDGVVTSLKEKYTLFAEDGRILRARVTMTFKSYAAVEVQLRAMKPESPDRTRVRVVREGETLAAIAAEAYGNARLWREIAEANDIDRPRFVAPGTALRIRAL